jgi:hypothetical protein
VQLRLGRTPRLGGLIRSYERAGSASNSPVWRHIGNLERNRIPLGRNPETRDKSPRKDLGRVKFKVTKI